MPKMLTLKQAAAETGLSYSYLRRLCLENKIFYIKSGNRFLLNADILAAYLNGESNAGLD